MNEVMNEWVKNIVANKIVHERIMLKFEHIVK